MDPGPTIQTSRDAGRVARTVWAAPAALVLLYLSAALPLIVAGNVGGRGAFDALTYHLPAIRTFAAELPGPDLELYPSSTTPLYHLVLAAVARLANDSDLVLQLASTAFTVGLLATMGRWCAARIGSITAFCCCLPLAASSYVFQSGVWNLPDNAAWWGVLGVLLIALDQRPARWWIVLGGGVLLLTVLTRQIHVWSAALLWAGAWLGPASDMGVREVLFRPRERARRTALAVLATLPAFGALAYFARLWGGLTPPMFQSMFAEPGYAAPVMLLSLWGVFSVFYAPFLAPAALRLFRERPWVFVAAGAAGLAIAAVPETTYSVAEGRFSGIWNACGLLGVVGGRTSVLLLGTSCVGAVAVACWVAAIGARDGLLLLVALAGFAAAQVATPMVFQRYQEPFVLMLMGVMACRVPVGRGTAGPGVRARAAGPLVLGVLWAGLTAAIQYRAQPAVAMPLNPKAREHPRVQAEPPRASTGTIPTR